tara:strand:+ start:58 stop:510 length:453 start_codon:yes stop_codon:yes gene_type:complete
MPKFPEEGGMPYKPFKMKGAFKDASTDAHPHQHLKMKRELASISRQTPPATGTDSPAPPYKPFKMKGFPFHNPEHAETKKQTDRRLREEGYSEEEIDIAMRTGDIPPPGARDEQMMEDQGIEGGGMPMGYKPLKHYSVKKGSHKHPHKKK